MKTKISALFMIVLLLATLVPLASAASTGLLFFWVDSPTETSLEVTAGDSVQVEYLSWASEDYDLTIAVKDSDGNDITSDVTSGRVALSSYSSTADNVVTIDTSDLDGDYTVEAHITAGSGSGADSDVITLELTVNAEINNAPEIISSPDLTVDEGDSYSYTVQAYDEDCDEVTFSEHSTFPSWASLGSSSYNSATCISQATVTGTAPESDGTADDDWDFIVVAEDEDGNIVYDQWIVTVNDLDSVDTPSGDVGLLLEWLLDNDGDGFDADDDATTDDIEIDYETGQVAFEYLAWADEGYDLEIVFRDGGVTVADLVDDFGLTSSDSTGAELGDWIELDSSYFENGAGTYSVEATVTTDSGETQTNTIYVIATSDAAENDAPTIDTTVDSDDLIVDEDEIFTLTVESSDEDGDTLTYEVLVDSVTDLGTGVLGSMENMDYTDNGDGTLDITFTPGYTFITHPETVDGFTMQITVSDPEGEEDTLTLEFTINDVNQVPEITTTPDDTAREGEIYTETIEATDEDSEDTLTYTLVNGPADMTIDFETGEVSWDAPTDTYSEGDEVDVEVIVEDGMGGSDTLAWTITITENSAPIFDEDGDGNSDDLEDQKVVEGETLTVEISTYDADSDDVAITIDADLAGFTNEVDFTDNGDGTATFVWDTDYDSYENWDGVEVTVTLDDGIDQTSDSFIIIIINNEAPELEAYDENGADVEDGDSISMDEDDSLNLDLVASDPEGDDLVITVDVDLDFEGSYDFVDNGDGTADFTFDTDFDSEGTYEVTFTVEDVAGNTDSISIKINVGNVNRAPTMELEDQITYEGETLEYTFNADDADADDFEVGFSEDYGDEFDLEDNGDGTYTFTWEDISYYAGSAAGEEYDFTLIAVDENGDETEDSFTVTVYDVNGPPIFLSEPDEEGIVDEDYTYQAIADDPEGEEVTYDIDGPDGMTIDEETGLVEWTPIKYGSFDVTVYASDESSNTASQSYTIIIREESKNVKFSNVMFDEEVTRPGSEVTLSVGMNNDAEKNLEDLQLSIVVYELGIRYVSEGFDLDSGDQLSELVDVYVPPSAREGVYDIRILVSNDEYHHVTHRTLRVI